MFAASNKHCVIFSPVRLLRNSCEIGIIDIIFTTNWLWSKSQVGCGETTSLE